MPWALLQSPTKLGTNAFEAVDYLPVNQLAITIAHIPFWCPNFSLIRNRATRENAHTCSSPSEAASATCDKQLQWFPLWVCFCRRLKKKTLLWWLFSFLMTLLYVLIFWETLWNEHFKWRKPRMLRTECSLTVCKMAKMSSWKTKVAPISEY